MCKLAIIRGKKNQDDYRVIRLDSWNDQLRLQYQMRGQLEAHYVNGWEGFELVEVWEVPWAADHPLINGTKDFEGSGIWSLEDARQYVVQLGGSLVPRRMKVVVKILEGRPVEIAAIDLTGDAWVDYLHHLNTATDAEAVDDLHGRNRAIRSAVISLISHLEGVVSDLCKYLETAGTGFHLPKRNNRRDPSTCQKIKTLRSHAKDQMGTTLSPLRLRLKLLRDIVAHPTIKKNTKEDEGSPPPHVDLDEYSVFELTAEQLRNDGAHIDNWLTALCHLYNYPRVYDTKEVILSLARRLGEIKTGPTRV